MAFWNHRDGKLTPFTRGIFAPGIVGLVFCLACQGAVGQSDPVIPEVTPPGAVGHPVQPPDEPRPPRPGWEGERFGGGPWGERAEKGERREGKFFDRLPEHVRKKLESLPPEQREAFRNNLQRWNSLPPEERDRLRKRQREHFQRAREEMEAIIKESGVTLDPSQRERFKRYYISERRALELELMRELEEHRKTRLPELRKKMIEALVKGDVPDVVPPNDRKEGGAPPPPPPRPFEPLFFD